MNVGSGAKAQNSAEQEMLSRNCAAISIGECYREGLIRLINHDFVPQIGKVLNQGQKQTLQSVNFLIVDDPDALGASSAIVNGSPVIRITSSVAYHIALFASAAVLNLFSGRDLSAYVQYQDKAVGGLADNTRRAHLGQPILPTPSFAEVEGINAAKVTEVMKNPEALGMSAYFAEVMDFWVLAHEVGHQVLGHARLIATAPGTPRKPMEMAADDFASRALVRMGYSVYPTIFLMGYFSAVDENGAGSPSDYPPSLCRLANVFSSAWSRAKWPSARRPTRRRQSTVEQRHGPTGAQRKDRLCSRRATMSELKEVISLTRRRL